MSRRYSHEEYMDQPSVVLKARSQTIEDLVNQCARGELAFAGKNSLYSKVAAMGYNTTSLYEAVIQAKYYMKESK